MKTVIVNDKMQRGYRYERIELAGKNFDAQFEPELTPKEMLELGVFGGKYLNDCKDEFPSAWFTQAKLSLVKDIMLNYFSVDASQPLSEWRKKGWIHSQDPRGWFQWYCRYYMGRRTPDEDLRQIKRWKAFRRHAGAVKNIVNPMIFSVEKSKGRRCYIGLMTLENFEVVLVAR